jgi:hypothetical protein
MAYVWLAMHVQPAAHACCLVPAEYAVLRDLGESASVKEVWLVLCIRVVRHSSAGAEDAAHDLVLRLFVVRSGCDRSHYNAVRATTGVGSLGHCLLRAVAYLLLIALLHHGYCAAPGGCCCSTHDGA